MKRRRASLAGRLAFPRARRASGPGRSRGRAPLAGRGSGRPSQGTCFGYNGVNDSYIPGIISGLRIALIQPVLTSTPYSQYDTGSFYAFYAKEARYNLVTANVTTNLTS